jgi:hypothetical protein
LHPHTKWGPEDRFALFELARGEWLEASAKANALS